MSGLCPRSWTFWCGTETDATDRRAGSVFRYNFQNTLEFRLRGSVHMPLHVAPKQPLSKRLTLECVFCDAAAAANGQVRAASGAAGGGEVEGHQQCLEKDTVLGTYVM